MNATQSKTVDEQAELISSLLEGEDAACWVVIPVEALVTQIQIAIRETRTKDARKAIRPDLAVVRLIRTLDVLGWTKITDQTDVQPAPHGESCHPTAHPHGPACSHTCPTCRGERR